MLKSKTKQNKIKQELMFGQTAALQYQSTAFDAESHTNRKNGGAWQQRFLSLVILIFWTLHSSLQSKSTIICAIETTGERNS